MDFYLEPGNSYTRLKEEFIKYGKLIFCVDFDDTIYDFHKKGRTYEQVINLLKRWEKYSDIIIWTGNGPEKHDFIMNYVRNHGINNCIGVNCDSTVPVYGKKVYANVYIDDRAGLAQVYHELAVLITKIENGDITR